MPLTLARALHVDDVEGRAQVQVVLGREVERGARPRGAGPRSPPRRPRARPAAGCWGARRSMVSSRSSISASSASCSLMWSPTARMAAIASSASPPAFFTAAISSLARLRSARLLSTSVSSCRRRSSTARNSSSDDVEVGSPALQGPADLVGVRAHHLHVEHRLSSRSGRGGVAARAGSAAAHRTAPALMRACARPPSSDHARLVVLARPTPPSTQQEHAHASHDPPLTVSLASRHRRRPGGAGRAGLRGHGAGVLALAAGVRVALGGAGPGRRGLHGPVGVAVAGPSPSPEPTVITCELSRASRRLRRLSHRSAARSRPPPRISRS